MAIRDTTLRPPNDHGRWQFDSSADTEVAKYREIQPGEDHRSRPADAPATQATAEAAAATAAA